MLGGYGVLTINFIGTQEYDEQLFVQCDCGEEIIEFIRNVSEKDGVEYVILPHLQSANKTDTYPSFCFVNKGEFSEFLGVLKQAKDDVDVPDVGIFYDKYLTCKNKQPGVLIIGYIKSDKMIAIKKFATPKDALKVKNCSWEMFINRNKAIEILDILEKWG